MITVTPLFFEKLHFKNVFRPQEYEKPVLSNSCGLKKESSSCFRDGLVWTVGLTVQITRRVQISPALCGRSHSVKEYDLL